MNLYNLSAKIRLLIDSAPDGELTDEVLDELDKLSTSFESKVETYCCLIEEAKARSTMKADAIKRLQAGKTVDENEAERLRKRLHEAMTIQGTRKVRTDLHLVYTQANTPSVHVAIEDLSLLPDRFVRFTAEPNKSAVLSYWRRTGEIPDGFEIVESESVRIK